VNAITLASWNVNSLKVRLPQVLAWLDATKTDAIVLQETKLADEAFPAEACEEAGYRALYFGQKTYNGVALLAKKDVFEDFAEDEIDRGLPGYPDEQKRLIAATLRVKGAPEGEAIRFVGGYFPNGMEPGSSKYLYKLDWLRALADYLKKSLAAHPRLVIGGDFNIAPRDIDVWDPAGWKGKILVSDAEREAYAHLLRLGLFDSFRLMHPDEGEKYSWWDYRMKGFENNHGLRIDHLLVSAALRDAVAAADIDAGPRGNPQPSDHAPITVTIKCTGTAEVKDEGKADAKSEEKEKPAAKKKAKAKAAAKLEEDAQPTLF
jgi:exodeoxyribonuclease III